MSQQQISRRQFGALALTGVGTTLLLAGCGTSATPNTAGATSTVAAGDAFKPAALNFEFWTNPVRTAYTAQIIQNYTSAHPKITVDQAPVQWSAYWTKLSTQVAGQSEPDIIQMDQAYIAEYGGRGALLNMADVGSIDFAPLKSSLPAGMLNGKLYGIPTGINAYGIAANKALFDKAGVTVPDDKTWTWNDYFDICAKLKQGSGGAFTGTTWDSVPEDLQIWLRQHGQQLYTDKGKLGFTTTTVTNWFTMIKKLFDAGNGPTPDEFTNDLSASVQQSLFGTGRAALAWMWSNTVTSFQHAIGGEVLLLRPPSVAGSASKNGLYYKPSQYWSIGAQTKHPAQAGALINYFLNSTEAAKLQLVERGVPVNAKVLAAIKPMLSATDQQAIQYLQSVRSEIQWVPPVPPKGTSTVASVLQRHTQDLIFGRATPASAAAAFKAEVQSLIDSAS